MSLLVRTPANCANALNLFVLVFIGRILLQTTISVFPPIVIPTFFLALCLGVLLAYIVYQCGWHPILALAPAILWMGPWPLLRPYLSCSALLFVLIQARLFLQKRGYYVGLMGARAALAEGAVKNKQPVSLRARILWLTGFAGIPWLWFLAIWVINPAYTAKFFEPLENIEPWIGPALLCLAVGLSGLQYFLCLEVHRLRAESFNWTTGTQLVITIFITVAIFFALLGILILTPAALTMIQQMKQA
jgi:hypothetical protein